MALSRKGEGAICVTGSSGLLGGLCVASLLRTTDQSLVLLHRAAHTRESLLAPIRAELLAQETPFNENDEQRIACLRLPANEQIGDLAPFLQALHVSEIVHAAGCVDYFDIAALRQGNEELTQALLDLGRRLGLARFVFISTAFSSGFINGKAPETLHADPREDPTDYVKSKRTCEQLVATSGIPFLVLRPSIVIGDSRDGRYAGKTYGVYQLWASAERLFTDRYHPVFHVIAPTVPMHLLHQDAFLAGFAAALRHLPDGSFVNLVWRQETLPSMRGAWEIFARDWGGPREVNCYKSSEEMPKVGIDRRQALLASFSSVNLEIGSYPWQFETGHLNRLRSSGLKFPDATLETLAICQGHFMKGSSRVEAFLERFGPERCATPRFIDASERALESVG